MRVHHRPSELSQPVGLPVARDSRKASKALGRLILSRPFIPCVPTRDLLHVQGQRVTRMPSGGVICVSWQNRHAVRSLSLIGPTRPRASRGPRRYSFVLHACDFQVVSTFTEAGYVPNLSICTEYSVRITRNTNARNFRCCNIRSCFPK